MTDAGERPRPQFGAFATPEEQRVRSGRAVEPVDPALVPRDMPPGAEPRATPGVRRRGFGDRVATIALLVFGLFMVLDSISAYTDPAALLDALRLEVELVDYAGQRAAGVVAVVVMLIGWLATTWFVWRRGVAGKSMWWIALIAGVVFTIIGGLIVAIPLVSDPNVFAAFAEMQGVAL